MAVASCLIGYGEVGLWLRRRIKSGEARLEGNPYRRWIEDYSGNNFLAAVDRGIGKSIKLATYFLSGLKYWRFFSFGLENLERRVAEDPPSPKRLAKLTAIWHECVRLERDFWDMGLSKSW